MGEVVQLADRRRRSAGGPEPRRSARATCYVDLADPGTYLVAEAVDRGFADVTWLPTSAAALQRTARAPDRSLSQVAADLRLPLVWPDRYPRDVPAAMRVASLAVERGRAGAFVLAAARLAFCGGYDLDDPEILAEAAAAAGLGLADALGAAGDLSRDGIMESRGRRLLAAGAVGLPVLRGPAGLVSGVTAVLQAASASVARSTLLAGA